MVGGGYKTGPGQNNLDPDKAAAICAGYHTLRTSITRQKLKTTMTMRTRWRCMQAGPANARGVPFYSRAVRPHARLCAALRAQHSRNIQKWRNSVTWRLAG